MMTFDLHIHTTRFSTDSIMDPYDMVRRAVEIGLDGLVITEHDAVWPEDQLEELRAAAPGLVILSGAEVSGRQGHVLVYGLGELGDLRPGIDWSDLCREVHDRGGVALAAHPNRFGQDFDAALARTRAGLDGIEVMSKNMDEDLRRRARKILTVHPHYASLGNSDAHAVEQLGVCVTRFDQPVYNNADLIEAIRARKCSPTPRT